MKTILFQGDSITDAGRSRQNLADLGTGYPHFVGARLSTDHPGEYNFINRAVGGNRSTDLYARVKADVINLAPDVMSVLIGVNDVWHEVDKNDGVNTAKFEQIYDMFLQEVTEALPNLKLMIIEPYVLKHTATEESWDFFRADVEAKAAVAKRLAEKYHAYFLPLQSILDEALNRAPVGHWVLEGVHPTLYGQQLIADSWIEAFNKM